MARSPVTNARRNVRAFLILGFLVALVASVGGALILSLGYSHPSVEEPLWKFGQYAMLLGLINLLIYFGIAWQIRQGNRGCVDSDVT
jgi:hypothetical protein